jgi:hypothetical protein
MPEDRVDRRLAAIFAGDIAGYSRLMGADEEGTLRQLKATVRNSSIPRSPNIAAESSKRRAMECSWNS